jgi:general secretion pathway protein I
MTPTSKAGTLKAEDLRMRAQSISPVPGPRGGFTLIEVVAALAVVSIGLLGLLRLHLMNLRAASVAETTTLAVLLAQEKMAEATSAGWPACGARSGTIEANGSEFTWRTEVTNPNSLATHGIARNTLRQLDVDVSWHEGAGPKSVRMTTYVADTRIP